MFGLAYDKLGAIKTSRSWPEVGRRSQDIPILLILYLVWFIERPRPAFTSIDCEGRLTTTYLLIFWRLVVMMLRPSTIGRTGRETYWCSVGGLRGRYDVEGNQP